MILPKSSHIHVIERRQNKEYHNTTIKENKIETVEWMEARTLANKIRKKQIEYMTAINNIEL